MNDVGWMQRIREFFAGTSPADSKAATPDFIAAREAADAKRRASPEYQEKERERLLRQVESYGGNTTYVELLIDKGDIEKARRYLKDVRAAFEKENPVR